MRPAAVLYDQTCNMCKTIMDTLMSWDRNRGRIRPVPIQSEEGQEILHEVPEDKRLASFHYAAPGEEVVSGGPALALMFRNLPGGVVLAKLFEASPEVTATGYEWVATNRHTISRFIPKAMKSRATRRLADRLEQQAKEAAASAGAPVERGTGKPKQARETESV